MTEGQGLYDQNTSLFFNGLEPIIKIIQLSFLNINACLREN